MQPKVEFTYDGKKISAERGQSIAAALHAAGVKVLARSMKYRRPRGLHCAGGYCPNCLVNVDGVSYERACVTPVEDGMVVESQMGMTVAGRDPLRVIDYAGFMFPLGFQYRYFKRQGPLYNAWEANLRRVAGHARMPAPGAPGKPLRRLAVDLCVVGGGPAGIGAATAALKNGITVALLGRWWGLSSTELVARRFARVPETVRESALALAGNSDVLL